MVRPVNIRSRRVSVTRVASWAFALLALVFLASLVGVFVAQSLPMWREVGWGFVTGKEWFYRRHLHGALSMVYGTAVVSAVALIVAVPLGVGAAMATAEMVSRRWRLAVKVAVELLAGIPSVVYGLLGILFLRTWVYHAFERWDPPSGDTLLTAGLLVAVMILPTLMTLADDAMRAVPATHREAARGLGLTHTETVCFVVLPQAFPGILAAVLLALGRAVGEMIAVFLVVGRQDNQWPANLLSLRPLLNSGQTLASKLGSSETNIAYGDPVHWGAMMGLGLLLLVLVGTITVLAFRLSGRFRDA